MFKVILFTVVFVFSNMLVGISHDYEAIIEIEPEYEIVTLTITAYAPSDNRSGICADDNPNVTATGTKPRKGVIAANFRRFPPGTKMYIPGYGFGIVEDTGGAMIRNPNHIDVCVDTYEEAIKWGKRTLQVKVYKHKEDDVMEKFIQERYEVYKAKNTLYGDSFVQSLDKWGSIAFAVRASDKLNRIRQLLSNKNFDKELSIVNDESLKDTVLDLFTYVCMYDAYVNQIDVLESMKIIANDPYDMAPYLFCQYGEKKEFLLHNQNPDDWELFENVVTLLKEYVKQCK